MSRVLTARALELLQMQTPALRSQPHFQASASAQAEQLDNLDAALDLLAALVVPKSSGSFVYIWEALARMSPASGASDADRVTAVLAFLARMGLDGGGSDWVAVGTQLIGTGWTYATHQAGSSDPTNPAPHHVSIYINTVTTGISRSTAQLLFESITSAAMVVDILDISGMLLDESGLDIGTLG